LKRKNKHQHNGFNNDKKFRRNNEAALRGVKKRRGKKVKVMKNEFKFELKIEKKIEKKKSTRSLMTIKVN